MCACRQTHSVPTHTYVRAGVCVGRTVLRLRTSQGRAGRGPMPSTCLASVPWEQRWEHCRSEARLFHD